MARVCGEARKFLSRYLPPVMMGWLLLTAFIWLANPHRLIIQCETSGIHVAVYTGTGADAVDATRTSTRPMTPVVGPQIATLLTREGFDVTLIDEHSLPNILPQVSVLVFSGQHHLLRSAQPIDLIRRRGGRKGLRGSVSALPAAASAPLDGELQECVLLGDAGLAPGECRPSTTLLKEAVATWDFQQASRAALFGRQLAGQANCRFRAGASFALKDHLHISAFKLASWPNAVQKQVGDRGAGAVKFRLTDANTISHAMEVLQLPGVEHGSKKNSKKDTKAVVATGFAHPHAEALFYFDSSAPIPPKDEDAKTAKLREIDRGKVAFGFNHYGRGKVLVGGPRVDVEYATGELPKQNRIEDRLMKFLILYVSPCMGETLQRAGWWEHTGLAFVYLFLALSFLTCSGTMWLLRYLDKRDTRYEHQRQLKAPSEMDSCTSTVYATEYGSMENHKSTDNLNPRGDMFAQTAPDLASILTKPRSFKLSEQL